MSTAAEKLAQIPQRLRKTYKAAMSGNSRVSAVRAMCHECMGWETKPRDCDDESCPLYPYRPGCSMYVSPKL